MHQDLNHLMEKYEEMTRKIGMSSSIDNLLNNIDLPYNKGMMMVPLLPKFKVSHMELYDWSRGPVEYLGTFKARMTLHGFPKVITYRAFPSILKGISRGWFEAL